MSNPLDDRLVIGISTRALFDLDAANDVYDRQGLEAYRDYQRAHEDDVLAPGTGLPLVKGLLALNERVPVESRVEVILLSRNDPDSCIRIYKSIQHHDLPITRGAFRGGRDPWPFLPVFRCDLFLSAEPAAVHGAIDGGTPAALVLRPPERAATTEPDGEVRIVFDGDAVLFGDESDRVWEEEGPIAYRQHETELAAVPLATGPFHPFLNRLARLQSELPTDRPGIRTALVTARGAPAHTRVINTLRSWNVRIDEAFFLDGLDKTDVLCKLEPHIVFDDKLENLERAAGQVPTAQVLPKRVRTSRPAFGEPLAPARRTPARAKRNAPADIVVIKPKARRGPVSPEPRPAGEPVERPLRADRTETATPARRPREPKPPGA